MPINASFEYQKAESKFLRVKSDEEKIEALEEMEKTAPSHKGAESLRANIRTRIKKLKEKIESRRKQKQVKSKEGIKKEGIQIVLVGLTNSGKSSLLDKVTNARPLISDFLFTTKHPLLGSLYYEGIKFQIIDMPAVNFESFDQGIANSADILLILITNIQDLKEILPILNKATGKKVVVFNKSDLLTEQEKRKISSFLQSKKYDFLLISAKTGENLNLLKEKLIANSSVIRIYTKQPGKKADEDPVTLPVNTTLEKLARKIFPNKVKIKEIRITGPSSKFPNQIVGLKHVLKDKDIVEFHTS